MSAAAQKAVMQEALDLSHQFRENSAMRNGIPTRPPRNVIGEEPEPRPIVRLMRQRTERDQTTTTTKETKTAPAAEPLLMPSTLPAWAKGALVTGAIGLSGLGGAALTQWTSGREPTPAPTQPEIVVTEPPASGDLLRWLSKEGYDRPPTPGKSP